VTSAYGAGTSARARAASTGATPANSVQFENVTFNGPLLWANAAGADASNNAGMLKRNLTDDFIGISKGIKDSSRQMRWTFR
jgi:hypothetical protein